MKLPSALLAFRTTAFGLAGAALAFLACCSGPRLSGGSSSAQATEWDYFRKPTKPVFLRRLSTEADPTAALVLSVEHGSLVDEAARQLYGHILDASLPYSDVYVLYHEDDDETVAEVVKAIGHSSAERAPTGSVYLVPSRINTKWVRDYGPVFGFSTGGRLVALDSMYRDVREEAKFERREKSKSPSPQREIGGDFGEVLTLRSLLAGVTPTWDQLFRLDDDTAPTYLVQWLRTTQDVEVDLVRPPVQLWGGDVFSDGRGTVFVSSETLVMNGGRTEEFENALNEYYGAKRVVYLEALPGQTIKHLDMFLKVLDGDRILLAEFQPFSESHGYYGGYLEREIRRVLDDNFERLRAAMPRARIVRVPLPSPIPELALDLGDSLAREAFDALEPTRWMTAAENRDPDASDRYGDTPFGSVEELNAMKRLVRAAAEEWRERLPALSPEGPLLTEFARGALLLSLEELHRRSEAQADPHRVLFETVIDTEWGDRALERNPGAWSEYLDSPDDSQEETDAIKKLLTAAAEAWGQATGEGATGRELLDRFAVAQADRKLDDLRPEASLGDGLASALFQEIYDTPWFVAALEREPHLKLRYLMADADTPDEMEVHRLLVTAAAEEWKARLPSGPVPDDELVERFTECALGLLPEELLAGLEDALPEAVIYRTYLNSVVINGPAGSTVLLPRYGPRGSESEAFVRDMERHVEAAYVDLLPGAELVWIDSDEIIEQFGALHCITCSVPASGGSSPRVRPTR